MATTETVDRLEEIKEEIHELLHEAKRLVCGTAEEQRAKSYWLAHIAMSLDDDHDYLGGGGITMQDTIDALRADEDDGDGNGLRICDQVYQGPNGFWRIAYKGHILPDDWTTREAAEAHLSTLRRTA